MASEDSALSLRLCCTQQPPTGAARLECKSVSCSHGLGSSRRTTARM